jgi:guanylate kinase
MTQQPAADAPARGTLFILSGPSGVGKNTVLRQAISRLGHIEVSVSVTTRSPRPGEINGQDYHFIAHAEFEAMLARGDFLEHAPVHTDNYGTPRKPVEAWLAAGTDVVLEIDVQGAMQVRHIYPDLVLVFLAPPTWAALEERLRGRNSGETEAKIQRRLVNARQEMQRIYEYHYVIINDRLAEAVDRFAAIVTAERCRPTRQDLRGLLEDKAHA